MKNKELVFILDRSGSMAGKEDDIIGGFNSTISKEKEDYPVYVSTVLFDNTYEIIHDRILMSEVERMRESDYLPGGSTALYDAIGKTISHIEKIHRYIRKEDVPDTVIVVIMSDGMENSSREFTSAVIKKMIREKENRGWKFVFMGADIDAYTAAEDIGISKERAVNVVKDGRGLSMMFSSVSECLMQDCEQYFKTDSWRKDLDDYYESKKS